MNEGIDKRNEKVAGLSDWTFDYCVGGGGGGLLGCNGYRGDQRYIHAYQPLIVRIVAARHYKA